jgi:ABC-type phosphate transport system substrate-binding protein
MVCRLQLEKHLNWLIFAIGLFILSAESFADAKPKQHALVLHHEIKLQTINRKTLRNLFTLKRSVWPNGIAVQIVVLESSSLEHKQFILENLGLFSYQVERIWKRQVFSGSVKSTIKVKNYDEMLDVIAKTPGSVGYINVERLKEIQNDSVTFITLDH